MLKTYPLFLIGLDRRRCVVLGGGEEAEHKVDGLLACDARVTLIAAEITDSLRHHVDLGRIEWVERDYQPGDLHGAFLAIAAGFDHELNAAAWQEAESERVLMNAADDVPHCSYIAGSVVRRGPLTVAISTGGCAPAVAVRLRERLERMLGAEYDLFLRWMWDLRDVIAGRHADFADRRRLWYRLVDSDILGLLRSGRILQARRRLHAVLEDDDLPAGHGARQPSAAAPPSASLSPGQRSEGP